MGARCWRNQRVTLFARSGMRGDHLASFAGAVEFSVSPHKRRPPYAESLGVTDRMDAWKWSTNQIRDNAHDSRWQHANNLGTIADTCTRAFPQMGHRRFPLYIQPPMAREWFDIWDSVCAIRAECHHSAPSPTSPATGGLNPTLPIFGRRQKGIRIELVVDICAHAQYRPPTPTAPSRWAMEKLFRYPQALNEFRWNGISL